MTLPTGNKRPRNADRRARGFTLIEFVLVMTMLLVVFGVAIPTLGNFFRGRTLDAEARRFVSLVRYGQSRAVSEGIPMLLWIDVKEGSYGLEQDSTYNDIDSKAVRFELDRELLVELPRGSVQVRQVGGASNKALRNLPAIRFQPDGFLGRGSPEAISILERKASENNVIWIAQTANGLTYEIQTNVWQNATR